MFNASINSEKDLLIQIAAGDEMAFQTLFNAYRSKLYSFILKISGSAPMAEDVVQDVFLKIWQMRADLRDIQHFNAYLFRMAHNHLLNAMKRMAKETLILAEMQGKSGSQAKKMDAHHDYKELEQLLRHAIENLPHRQKMVFILSREKGMKQEEISRQLNISVVTVKSHMTQALRSIRKQIRHAYPVISFYLVLLIRLISR